MPGVARGNGGDTVVTGHGCDAVTTTGACSSNVRVNGKGIVRFGDAVLPHLFPVGRACVPHAPTLDGNYSNSVKVNSKFAAFEGSTYLGHVITSSSSSVKIGR